MSWGIIVLAAVAGVLVGASGRLLLGRLRRGVRLRAGPVELACGVLFAVVAWRGPPAWWLPVPLVLSAFAVLLAAVDLLRLRLPDALTLPAAGALGLALAAAAVVADDPALWWSAGLGALVFFGSHLLVHRLRPGSLGAGDVKLSGGLGGVLGAVGWPALAVGACLAAFVTLGLAVAARAFRVRAWSSGVPHGPGLLVATWLVAVFPGTGSGVGP